MNQFAVETLKKHLQPIVHVKQPVSNRMNRAAVVLILNSFENGISLLLVRRAVRQGDPWSGQMAFPGGYMTAHDTSLLDTAIRETREEVGINLLDHELLGTIDEVYSATRVLTVTPLIALLRNKVVLILKKDEVADATWAPLSDLSGKTLVRRRVGTSKGELEVDGIQYRDQIIWGLTLRMIKDFLSRL